VNRQNAILAIFVLSGSAGLVYEVVWARQLVLVFGNTTQAVSTILTGFFAGLAIGSVIGGRIADRSRSALRLYGLLELALVAVVLLTPLLFQLVRLAYQAGFDSLEGSPTALTLLRFGLALVSLAPATVLMGATLPSLSRYLARRRDDLGAAFGRLYMANTVGAIVGTLVAGLVAIEVLGLTLTLVAGAVCSGTAGLFALLLDWRIGPLEPLRATQAAHGEPTAATSPAGSVDRTLRRLALAASFVSGLTSIGYQVLWTRLLSSGTGNSTYVFTLILAFFLLGIAFGAAVITSRPPARGRVVRALAATQLAIGLLALLGIVATGGRLLTLGFAEKVLIVVVPATIAIGLSLPLASNLVGSSDESVGRDTGLLLAVNTAGIIVATFVVPFALVPRVGSPATVALFALVNLAFAVLLAAADPSTEAGRSRAICAARNALVGIAAIGIAGWSGAIVDPAVTSIERDGELWETAEDEIASVQAGRLGNHAHLWVGGTSMTALTVDARLMPALPTMLRPEARRLLVIAFGMGSSYRTGLLLGHVVDGVELVPSIPDMFRHYYPDAEGVLADPRGRVHITDGRNFAELTDDIYDIVVVDPPPPIRSSGTAVLYSREFYEATAARLAPAGVMMEWMPFDQTVDEFRAHVRTFRAVFPEVVLAFGPGGFGVFMLGSREPLSFDEAAVRHVLRRPGVLEDLSSAHDSPVSTEDGWAALIPGLVWASGDGVTRFAGEGALITDDRPLTEYFLLRSLFSPPSPPMGRESLLQAVAPADQALIDWISVVERRRPARRSG